MLNYISVFSPLAIPVLNVFIRDEQIANRSLVFMLLVD